MDMVFAQEFPEYTQASPTTQATHRGEVTAFRRRASAGGARAAAAVTARPTPTTAPAAAAADTAAAVDEVVVDTAAAAEAAAAVDTTGIINILFISFKNLSIYLGGFFMRMMPDRRCLI